MSRLRKSIFLRQQSFRTHVKNEEENLTGKKIEEVTNDSLQIMRERDEAIRYLSINDDTLSQNQNNKHSVLEVPPEWTRTSEIVSLVKNMSARRNALPRADGLRCRNNKSRSIASVGQKPVKPLYVVCKKSDESPQMFHAVDNIIDKASVEQEQMTRFPDIEVMVYNLKPRSSSDCSEDQDAECRNNEMNTSFNHQHPSVLLKKHQEKFRSKSHCEQQQKHSVISMCDRKDRSKSFPLVQQKSRSTSLVEDGKRKITLHEQQRHNTQPKSNSRRTKSCHERNPKTEVGVQLQRCSSLDERSTSLSIRQLQKPNVPCTTASPSSRPFLTVAKRRSDVLRYKTIKDADLYEQMNEHFCLFEFSVSGHTTCDILSLVEKMNKRRNAVAEGRSLGPFGS